MWQFNDKYLTLRGGFDFEICSTTPTLTYLSPLWFAISISFLSFMLNTSLWWYLKQAFTLALFPLAPSQLLGQPHSVPEDNRAAGNSGRTGHHADGHNGHVDSGDHDGEGGKKVDLLSLHFSAIHWLAARQTSTQDTGSTTAPVKRRMLNKSVILLFSSCSPSCSPSSSTACFPSYSLSCSSSCSTPRWRLKRGVLNKSIVILSSWLSVHCLKDQWTHILYHHSGSKRSYACKQCQLILLHTTTNITRLSKP